MANSFKCTLNAHYDGGSWAGEITSIGFSGVYAAANEANINAELPNFDVAETGDTGTTTHTAVAYGTVGDEWTKAVQDQIIEGAWAMANSLKYFTPTSLKWNEIRLSACETSHPAGIGGEWETKVIGGATVATITTPLAGSNTMGLPPQTAAVCSLVSGGRGPRNKGRVFLPVTALGLSGDALINSSNATSMLTPVKTFLTSVAANASGFTIAVVSRTHATYSNITALRVGDEVDTQRRRRNARNEVYTSVTFP